MAIQFLRDTSKKADSNDHKSKVLSAGQPFIETDTKTLYIGDGEKTLAKRYELPHFLDSSAVLDCSTYQGTSPGSVKLADNAARASSCSYWYLEDGTALSSPSLCILYLSDQEAGSHRTAICLAPVLNLGKDQNFPCLTFGDTSSFAADVLVGYKAQTKQFILSAPEYWQLNLTSNSAPYRSFYIPLG